MLSEIHASSLRLRSERSSETVIACDITANSIVLEIFDSAMNRAFSRTALYGLKITSENIAETLRRLFSTAMRSAGVPARAVKGAVFAAGVHISDCLEQELSADDLGLEPGTEIMLVPYISARLSGRFTASLLTVGSGNYSAVDLGGTLCAAENKGGRITCAGFSLAGAFDGTAFESGMPAENGAIDAIRRENDGTIAYEVIGDGESLGISPSGAACAAHIMLSEGILDSDGIMTDRDLFAVGEDFFVSQSDIRAVQSDKAKCAAALELFGSEKLYLSGAPFTAQAGFRAMSAIGAIDERFAKANFCGNSTLRGAERYILSEKFRETAREIVKNADDISERIIEEFDKKYFENLSFVKTK